MPLWGFRPCTHGRPAPAWRRVLAGAVASMVVAVTAGQVPAAPPRILVSAATHAADPALAALIADTRQQVDAFVFLSGGASRMSPADQQRLVGMFDALAQLAAAGRRIAVGDGGTHAGIMQAAGEARRASRGAFPLIGIAPAREVAPRGRVAPDPHHSALVLVDDPGWPADKDAWGSETQTMYAVFERLSAGRRSVTVVANGGGITLDEVAANVRAGRTMIVIEGSGRAADALVSLVRHTTPVDDEVVRLRGQASAAGLAARPQLFRFVPLSAGAAGLASAIARELFEGQ